jgi:hypothetical protein
LINELSFAENIFFSRDESEEKNCCPKTLEKELVIRNHLNLTIHAVAHWLEKIYPLNEHPEDKITSANVKEWSKLKDLDDTASILESQSKSDL